MNESQGPGGSRDTAQTRSTTQAQSTSCSHLLHSRAIRCISATDPGPVYTGTHQGNHYHKQHPVLVPTSPPPTMVRSRLPVTVYQAPSHYLQQQFVFPFSFMFRVMAGAWCTGLSVTGSRLHAMCRACSKQ